MNPQVIFEDEHILVIDKPAGLVVDRSETGQGPTLEDWLAEKFNNLPKRSGIVHRLDKDTSGLLLVAKTTPALENLQKQFAGKVVKKEYLTLVHGLVEAPGKVEGSIGRNPRKREKFTVLGSGKESTTEYEPVEKLQVTDNRLQEIFQDFNNIQRKKLERMGYGQFTLLKCYPLTGRTHQIRVHLKYIDHPVVADEKYVGRRMYRLDHRWCERQFLHAAKIRFKHPVSGVWLEFESDLPADLKKALSLLNG